MFYNKYSIIIAEDYAPVDAILSETLLLNVRNSMEVSSSAGIKRQFN